MLLFVEIFCAVLAVFGAYVLIRRLLAREDTLVFAVRRQKNISDEELLHLVHRTRGDAWLCGKPRVVLLDENGQEMSEKRN